MKGSESLKVLKTKVSRLLWLDLRLHADSSKALIQNPVTSCLCSFQKVFFFFCSCQHFILDQKFPSREMFIPHNSFCNGMFYPRELLEVISSAEEIVGKHSARSFLSRAFGARKPCSPKWGIQVSPLWCCMFVHSPSGKMSCQAGDVAFLSHVAKNVMTVPLTSIV